MSEWTDRDDEAREEGGEDYQGDLGASEGDPVEQGLGAGGGFGEEGGGPEPSPGEGGGGAGSEEAYRSDLDTER